MKSYRLIAGEAWNDGDGWSYNETAAITDYKTAGRSCGNCTRRA